MESEDYKDPHQTPENSNLESEGNLGQNVKNNRESRMRKRVQKLAPKMLLKDGSEEENSADDSLDDSQKDASSNVLDSPTVLLSNDSKKGPTIEKDIQYEAEFYEYRWGNGNEYIPLLQKRIMKRKPIVINRSTRASKLTNTSCFDVTSMYAIPNETTITDDAAISEAVIAELGTYITIRSRFLLDYLKHIVVYYPTVSFDTEELVLKEPFCVLLHYRQELRERSSSVEKAISDLGFTEGGDSSMGLEHLTALSNYLEQRYADALSRELLRHQGCPAMCTYEWMWLLFKPGSLVYSWADGVLEAFVVQDHDKQAHKGKYPTRIPPKTHTLDELESTPRQQSLHVTVWYLTFNGERLGRCRENYDIPKFDGEKPIISLPIFPQEFMKHDKRVHESLSTEGYLIHRGQRFFEMTRRSYRHYEGDTANLPRRIIRGRVMVDTKYFVDSGYTTHAEVGFSSGPVPRRNTRDTAFPPPITGTRRNAGDTALNDCSCHPVTAVDRYGHPIKDAKNLLKTKDVYAHYDGITPDKCNSLDSQQYMICAPTIMAFVLKTRRIEELFVDKLSKPVFQVNLMKELVLDDDAKAMVKALSQRYTMHAETNDTWGADFVVNNGEGQIFLLHGKPGVGKTATAECVAELTQRPLLSLTCGDLGVNPEDLEVRLNTWLKRAELWGAILLLDEAEVYLESRITQDLRRNALVSIFLRALEYYQGLLFLTSNRVGTFDDAFVSRIHVVIHYPDFTNEKRCQIWEIFFNKLEREKENIKFTQRTVDYAKESKEIQSLGWNGREIRNAFSTAVALAEFDNERDDKMRVIFHARHLEQVVKMSRAFQDYLKSTHGMSQSDQARRFRIRNDDWKGPGEQSGS